MANPNPKTEHLKATQWKKGQSGNPTGARRPYTDNAFVYSNKRAPAAMIHKVNTMLPCMFCSGKGEVEKTRGNVTKKTKCRKCHGFKFERLLPDNATCAQVAMMVQNLKSMNGDLSSTNFLTDHIEGSAPQRIELSSPPDAEIRLRIIEDTPASRKK